MFKADTYGVDLGTFYNWWQNNYQDIYGPDTEWRKRSREKMRWMEGNPLPNGTDAEKTVPRRLRGRVGIGGRNTFTESKRRVALGNYGRPHKDDIRSNIWRWQSIAPYAPLKTGTQGTTSLDFPARSLDLGIVRKFTTATAGTATGFWMPMYAIDLGTQPTQGHNQSTKTTGQLQSYPVYRMKKLTGASALSPTTANYQWAPVLGLNNFPQIVTNAYSPYWNAEVKEVDTATYSNVKRCWTEIELLFQCSRTMDCSIHVATVKFDKWCAPRRLYTNGDTSTDVAGQATARPTEYTLDTNIDVASEEQQAIDGFWEMWWDNKLAHPLSKWNSANKASRLKFLSHEVIEARPTPNSDSANNAAGGYVGLVQTHKKKIFIGGGKWINCNDNSSDDQQIAVSAGVTRGQQPPVFLSSDAIAANASTENGFTKSYGFNIIDRTLRNCHLTDNYSRRREDGNPWLLIWMEERTPVASHPSLYIDDAMNWPPTYEFKDNNFSCCTFDMRIRSKVSYCGQENAVSATGYLLNAYQNVA